jgi:hypothetical protein
MGKMRYPYSRAGEPPRKAPLVAPIPISTPPIQAPYVTVYSSVATFHLLARHSHRRFRARSTTSWWNSSAPLGGLPSPLVVRYPCALRCVILKIIHVSLPDSIWYTVIHVSPVRRFFERSRFLRAEAKYTPSAHFLIPVPLLLARIDHDASNLYLATGE